MSEEERDPGEQELTEWVMAQVRPRYAVYLALHHIEAEYLLGVLEQHRAQYPGTAADNLVNNLRQQIREMEKRRAVSGDNSGGAMAGREVFE